MKAGRLIKRLWGRESKASYTVEAAGVMSIIMIIIGSSMVLGFEIYQESTTEIAKTVVDGNSLEKFRMSNAIKGLTDR